MFLLDLGSTDDLRKLATTVITAGRASSVGLDHLTAVTASNDARRAQCTQPLSLSVVRARMRYSTFWSGHLFSPLTFSSSLCNPSGEAPQSEDPQC